MKEFNWVITASNPHTHFNHQVLIPSFHDLSMLVTLTNISELRVVAFRMMRAVMIRQEIWSRRYVSIVAYASRILLFTSSFDLVLSGTSRSPFIAVYNCSSTMHSK